MQTETITALQIFEQGLSKSEIKSMANNAVESVLEQGNPLGVAEAITAMEAFITEVKADKRFKDYVREEAAKHGKNGFKSQSGAKIEACEVGGRYDFSKSNDPELEVMEGEMDKLSEKISERKDFLKMIPAEGIETRFGDELITLYPPAKSSTSSYKVTLAK